MPAGEGHPAPLLHPSICHTQQFLSLCQKQSHKGHSCVKREEPGTGVIALVLGTQLVPLTSSYKVAHLALLLKGCRLLRWTGPQSSGTSHSGSVVPRLRWVTQCEGLCVDLRGTGVRVYSLELSSRFKENVWACFHNQC